MKTTLRIEGMRCAGCADNVDRALRRGDGVENVQVNLEDKCAIVTHTQHIESTSLAKIVNDIGYKTTVGTP